MSYRRDQRASRAALFDDIEEGGLRASSHSRDIDEHGNEKAIDSLQDRVSFLKRLTGDIHEEVDSHNRMLSQMGNDMDASRGIMSGTMARFKMVFEKKSNRRMCKLAVWFVVAFFVVFYTIRIVACGGASTRCQWKVSEIWDVLVSQGIRCDIIQEQAPPNKPRKQKRKADMKISEKVYQFVFLILISFCLQGSLPLLIWLR